MLRRVGFVKGRSQIVFGLGRPPMRIITSCHRVLDKPPVLTSVDANVAAVKRARIVKQVDYLRAINVSVVNACNVFGVSRSRATYYRWRRNM